MLVDERADVFSLAVVTWQALTGKSPFAAASASESLTKIYHGAKPPLSKVDPSLAGTTENALMAHVAIRRLAPGADPAILPIVFVLAGIGITFVTRLAPNEASSQVIWLFLSVVAMPRTSQQHYRPKSATEQAEEEEGARKGKHRAGLIIGIIAGIAALAVAAYFVITMECCSAAT